MPNFKLMILILVMIISVGIVGVVFIIKMDRQSRSMAKSGLRRKKYLISIPRYLKISNTLHKNFLSRGDFNRIQNQLALLSVYSPVEIKIEAVKFYFLSTSVTFIVILGGALLFRQLFTILLVTCFALVVKNVIVDKQLDKIHFRLLNELSITLSSVRQNYLRTNSIPDSIAESEKGELLSRPMEEIFNVLTTLDGERKLDEFIETCPFRLLQTLAGICYHINEVGDTQESEDSGSGFVNALSMISDEVNLEIQRIAKQKARFGFLEILPLLPLPAIALIEAYFSSIIPGTSILYKGLLGYISRMVITSLGIIGYTVITRINRAVVVPVDDRSNWTTDLLKIDLVSRFINQIRPKKKARVDRISKQLRSALSRKSDRDITLESIVYVAITFPTMLILIITAINLSREFIYNNVGSLSLMSSENLTEEDIEERKRMDAEFLLMPEEPSTSWTASYVNRKLPNIPEFDRQEQEHRLLTKYKSYHNTSFRWYMVLIAYAFTVLAAYTPKIKLVWRKWLLSTETEEDVLQMQTIVAIIMNTMIDTLDTLEWLARQSKIHKSAITTCYHEYVSNPELALERLKASSSSVIFQRIVDKLMQTIHLISLKRSFSDLVSERSHILRLREISQDALLAKRRLVAGILAVSPLGALVILHLLLPIGILGARELIQAMSNISI